MKQSTMNEKALGRVDVRGGMRGMVGVRGILGACGAAMIAVAGCGPGRAPEAAGQREGGAIGGGVGSQAGAKSAAAGKRATQGGDMSDKVIKTEEQWKKELTPEQYRILREKGTERAFTGKYWNTKTPGVYTCAGCGLELFTSDMKFDSGCGWPSFDREIGKGRVEQHVDTSYGMVRTEITCARCGGHLGHIFNDGPTDTGQRYCVNSASVELEAKSAEAAEGDAAPKSDSPKAELPKVEASKSEAPKK